MKSILWIAVFTIASAAPALDQTEKEIKYETKKLARLLKGKALACFAREDEKKEVIFTLSVSKKKVKAGGDIAGYGPYEQISQLNVGSNLVVEVSGVDSDEGTALVIVPTYYLEEYGETEADAVLYATVGPGDGSGELKKLSCDLR